MLQKQVRQKIIRCCFLLLHGVDGLSENKNYSQKSEKKELNELNKIKTGY